MCVPYSAMRDRWQTRPPRVRSRAVARRCCGAPAHKEGYANQVAPVWVTNQPGCDSANGGPTTSIQLRSAISR